MPTLTPVDHNPFAGDMANALGQGTGDSSAAVSPNSLQSAQLFKWLVQKGHDPLGDVTGGAFGDDDASPRDNRAVGQELQRNLMGKK